jgi:hypothetical protein
MFAGTIEIYPRGENLERVQSIL